MKFHCFWWKWKKKSHFITFIDMRSKTLQHVRHILFKNKSKKKNPSIFLWWFASVIPVVCWIHSLLAGSTFFFISWNFTYTYRYLIFQIWFAFNFLVFSFCWDTVIFVNVYKVFIFEGPVLMRMFTIPSLFIARTLFRLLGNIFITWCYIIRFRMAMIRKVTFLHFVFLQSMIV